MRSNVATADPATIRPSLALAAAENVEALKASLLEAAASATKPTWITVECAGCGERSRVEAPVPDVRARLAAIQLLLAEGLGKPPQGEETPRSVFPADAARVRQMSWDELQILGATIFVDEITAIAGGGGQSLLRERVASLSVGERRLLREVLSESDAA